MQPHAAHGMRRMRRMRGMRAKKISLFVALICLRAIFGLRIRPDLLNFEEWPEADASGMRQPQSIAFRLYYTLRIIQNSKLNQI